MGLRATIIKTYNVVYGDVGGFNYGCDFLGALISAYCPTSYTGGDHHDVDAIWTVDKGEFTAMLKKLKWMTCKTFSRKAVEEWGAEPDDGYDKAYVVKMFERWLEESDPSDDWLRFGWL